MKRSTALTPEANAVKGTAEFTQREGMGGASPKKQQPPPPPEEFIEAKTPAWKRSLARYHQGVVHRLRKLLNLSAAFW